MRLSFARQSKLIENNARSLARSRARIFVEINSSSPLRNVAPHPACRVKFSKMRKHNVVTFIWRGAKIRYAAVNADLSGSLASRERYRKANIPVVFSRTRQIGMNLR